MLFPEEDTPHLKAWIVKRLENTSDADPDVLADYVLALLRHDGDIDDVRKLCEDEIPDFLKEDSPVFVNDVFEAIAYRSYLPGAPPPPPKNTALPPPSAAGQVNPGLYYDDTPMGGAAATYPPRFPNGSRKRAYTDWDDPNAQNGRDGAGGGYGGRTFKQARRGGRGPGPNEMYSYGNGAPAAPPYPPPGQYPPDVPPGPSTVGYFDPKAGMGVMYGMSLAAGHPMPEFVQGFPPKKRKKCRDWEKKGYCPRGTNCMFAHSNDPVYPPVPGPPFGNPQAPPQPQAVVEEYDPTNALMPDLYNPPDPYRVPPSIPDSSQQQQHQQRARGGKQPNRPRRGEKAPFSADGPVFDRTRSTIVVENIPEENFDEAQVRQFFSQFGNILEVSMQPYKRLAIVKYDSWSAANAAYQSPKVIFDNRFVKVFWYKDEGSTLPASGSAAGGPPGGKKAKHANGSSGTDGHDGGAQSHINLEEFARKQEEKQKAFEEKARKREELERQREELEKRQKELLAKQQEERAKLEAKLGKHSGAKSENDEGASKKPMSQTEALRAQLAALEAEARQMGLDPDAMDAPSPWPPRGGYGRGRGGWRGSTPPYMARGSYRGGFRGRGNIHAAYAAYTLDNRPKKVILTGVDFTVPEKDEALRQYLFGIGEFTDIQTTPTSTEITFKDRKTAEKFFNSVLLANKEIPGLDDDASSSLDLAWGSSNSGSSSASTTSGARAGSTSTDHGAEGATNRPPRGGGPAEDGNGKDRDDDSVSAAAAEADTAAGASSSDKDVHIQLEQMPTASDHPGQYGNHQDQRQQQQQQHAHRQEGSRDHQNMDYEVADEEQWGY
ncbi:hypothetical protein VTH06DRAFT_2975 [Thermothelomyces fergusii]